MRKCGRPLRPCDAQPIDTACRDPSITDGTWNKRDAQLVAASQEDAAQAVSAARVDAEGDLG